MINWLKSILFKKELKQLRELEAKLDSKLREQEIVYTTIKTHKGIDREYYSWVCNTLASEEYRFCLFDIRENIIREMAGIEDKEKAVRFLGRLDMVNIIENYLRGYKNEYEAALRRDSQNTEK